MVFYWRCFSSMPEIDEPGSITNSTTKYGTAQSAPTLFVPHSQEISNLAQKFSNLRVFTLSELEKATQKFSDDSKIGEGGFGIVYKGIINRLEHPFDEIKVAVKLGKGLLQGYKEWETEINVLGVVDHPNLVKLIGYYGKDNEDGTQLILVYEFMVNRSVKHHLSGNSRRPLSWYKRLKVAQDAARGLTYLHEGMDPQIIFRDFKSSNILLDDQWNAKLSDFGLARVGPLDGHTHVSTKFVGTSGYGAPEYLSAGHLTAKSDVWSYGVFLCELISGRRPVLDKMQSDNNQTLVEWIKPYLGSSDLMKVIDPRLEGDYLFHSVEELALLANSCLDINPESRPSMSIVLEKVNQLSIGEKVNQLSIGVPSQADTPVTYQETKRGLRCCPPWLASSQKVRGAGND